MRNIKNKLSIRTTNLNLCTENVCVALKQFVLM